MALCKGEPSDSHGEPLQQSIQQGRDNGLKHKPGSMDSINQRGKNKLHRCVKIDAGQAGILRGALVGCEAGTWSFVLFCSVFSATVFTLAINMLQETRLGKGGLLESGLALESGLRLLQAHGQPC